MGGGVQFVFTTYVLDLAWPALINLITYLLR